MAKKKAVKKGSAEAKRRMAKVRSAKKTTRKVGRKKVTKTYTKERQTPVEWTNSGGYLYQYNKKKDGVRQALPPGQRMSKNGNVYYEYRANRTDISKGKPKGQMFGVEKHYDTNSHNTNLTLGGIDKRKTLDTLYYGYAKTMIKINELQQQPKSRDRDTALRMLKKLNRLTLQEIKKVNKLK